MSIIVIDPGHGGYQLGAVIGQVQEKNINLQIALLIGKFLFKKGHVILYTRDVDNTLNLADRLRIISEANADALISIHCNAIEDNPNTKQDERKFVHGVEIFYRDEEDKNLAASMYRMMLKADIGCRGMFQDKERLGKRLAVLNNVKVPSILVELGYLTNTNDLAFIISNKFSLAELISVGIADYLENRKG